MSHRLFCHHNVVGAARAGRHVTQPLGTEFLLCVDCPFLLQMCDGFFSHALDAQ